MEIKKIVNLTGHDIEVRSAADPTKFVTIEADKNYSRVSYERLAPEKWLKLGDDQPSIMLRPVFKTARLPEPEDGVFYIIPGRGTNVIGDDRHDILVMIQRHCFDGYRSDNHIMENGSIKRCDSLVIANPDPNMPYEFDDSVRIIERKN